MTNEMKFVYNHNNVNDKISIKCRLKCIWSHAHFNKGFYVQGLLKIEKLT